MIPFRKSLGFRLLGMSVILLALPLLVDAFILVNASYEKRVADAESTLVELANLRELPLSTIQDIDAPLLKLIIDSMDLAKNGLEGSHPEIDKKFQELAEAGKFNNIFLGTISPEKKVEIVHSAKKELIGENYAFYLFLDDPFSDENYEKGYIQYVHYNDKTGKIYFLLTRIIYKENTRIPLGFLAIESDVTQELSRLLTNENALPVKYALLFPSTVVFLSTDPALRFQYFLPLDPKYRELMLKLHPSIQSILAQAPLPRVNLENPPLFSFMWQGEEQTGYIKRFFNSNFALLIYTSKAEIFRVPFKHFFDVYGSYLFLIIGGALIAYFLTLRMTQPIRSLSIVMQKIQEDAVDVRYAPDRWGFEINELGEVFNTTIDTLLETKKTFENERVKRETLAQDLELGRQAQLQLLPLKMPDYPGAEMVATYIPATEVAGDFYDLFVREIEGEEELVLAIADASGKGVTACFYSFVVRSALRAFGREIKDMGAVCAQANEIFQFDVGETGMFITAVAGVYNRKKQQFSYYSCGHNPPFLRKNSGEIIPLEQHGMALGFMSFENAHESVLSVASGDVLVFYTDGVTEAHNTRKELFEERRLIDALKEPGTAEEISDRILKHVRTFVGDAPQHDDITLIVVKIV